MKTLYININNETIQSNDELEVLKHDLDSDFFFYLGEKIAKGCKVENENALITDFNSQGNEDDYKQIIAQWNEIKTILFSEECNGNFEFTLPNGYIHWLKFHPQYVSIYDRNFSHCESSVITIDLEELYEDSVEDMQRKILRKLHRNDLYQEIDEIVFNNDAVTRKSPIVHTIKDKYEGVGFKTYKEWLQDNNDFSIYLHPLNNIEIGKTCLFDLKFDNIEEITNLVKDQLRKGEVKLEIGNFEFCINQEGIFTSLKIKSDSNIPQNWYENFGWTWNLDFDEWILILNKKKFVVYEINKPNNILRTGSIYAQSPCKFYRIIINFSDGKISDICIDYILNNTKYKDVSEEYLADKKLKESSRKVYTKYTCPINYLFPLYGIIPGKTTSSEIKLKYGSSPYEFMPSDGIVFYLSGGVYDSVKITNIPNEWLKWGIVGCASIDDMKRAFLNLGFEYCPVDDIEYLELLESENVKELIFSADIVDGGHYSINIEYKHDMFDNIHINYYEDNKEYKDDEEYKDDMDVSDEVCLYSCPVCDGDLLKIGHVTYVCKKCNRPWSSIFNDSCPNCESDNVISYNGHCACLNCHWGWTKGVEFMKCPTCHSDNIEDNGTSFLQFSCNDCNEIWGLADIICPSCLKHNTRRISSYKWHCDNCGHDFE